MERKMEKRIIQLFKTISNCLKWFSLRLDFYVETKEWEIEKRNKLFPKEWFEDTSNKDEQE